MTAIHPVPKFVTPEGLAETLAKALLYGVMQLQRKIRRVGTIER